MRRDGSKEKEASSRKLGTMECNIIENRWRIRGNWSISDVPKSGCACVWGLAWLDYNFGKYLFVIR